MTYSELQDALRSFRYQGLTSIKLNSSRQELEVELERLTTTETEETEPEAIETEEVEAVGRTLVLAVDKKWFDMIASGEKKEEYREIKPHFESRFDKPITHIKFTNGYGHKVPSVTVELIGMWKGIPKPGWSEGTIEQGTEVFILRLGDIVDPKPIECSDCDGSGYTNDGGNVFPCWCEIGCRIIDEKDEDEPLYNWEEDKLEDKVDEFLLAVKQQQLSSEQLEAIALAMVVGHKKHQAMSTVLANYKKFHLFTPNQLLAWGFDQIIPGTGLFQQFRRAINSTIKPSTAVNVSVIDGAEGEDKNALSGILESWASSYGGKSWCVGVGGGLFEKCWEFPSLESAEKFIKDCQQLDFVVAVEITGLRQTLLSPEKVAELGMVSA